MSRASQEAIKGLAVRVEMLPIGSGSEDRDSVWGTMTCTVLCMAHRGCLGK